MSKEHLEINTDELVEHLWIELADESDGWQTTMNYSAFKEAIDKVFKIIKTN